MDTKIKKQELALIQAQLEFIDAETKKLEQLRANLVEITNELAALAELVKGVGK